MARGAAKRRQARPQPQPASTRRAARQRRPVAEETMFFPRLRRQAKWAFAVMVIVFGLGFVFLGVGTGSGVGDLLSDRFSNLFSGGSSGPSISKARERIADNPKDAPAYRELAAAYRAKDRSVEAIQALKRYVALRPKDTDALQELASLELGHADALRQRAAAAYQEQQQASLGQSLGPSPTSTLGQALGDPITQALSTAAGTQFNELYARTLDAYRDVVGTYKRLAALQPDAASIQQELAFAAESAGDTATALAAWRRYLKIAPLATDADAVRQRIKQLQAQTTLVPNPSGR